MSQSLVAFRTSDNDLKKVDKLIILNEFRNRSDFFRKSIKKMLKSYQKRLDEKTFFTVGYEGIELEDFIEKLKENNIDRIVDVREIPLSRKNGFSKKVLSQKLEGEDINYFHIRELGSPKDIREKYRSNRDVDWFMIKYRTHLEGLNGAYTRLKKFVEQENTCIMCFEKDFTVCHRSIIADKLKEEGYSAIHI